MWWEKSGRQRLRSRDWLCSEFSRLPTMRTAMIFARDDSTVSVIFTGSGVSICCKRRNDDRPAGATQGSTQQQTISPLQMQKRPAHERDQPRLSPKLSSTKTMPAGKVSQRLAKSELQPALEKDQDEGQGSQNAYGTLKIAGIYQM